MVRNEHERPGNPLAALVNGRAWTAGEPLGRLVAGALLAEERQGRHRYVRLADPRSPAWYAARTTSPSRTPTWKSGATRIQDLSLQ